MLILVLQINWNYIYVNLYLIIHETYIDIWSIDIVRVRYTFFGLKNHTVVIIWKKKILSIKIIFKIFSCWSKCCFNTPYKLNYYIAWYEYIISFIHKLINDKLNVKVFELKTKNMQSKIDKWYAKKFYNQSKSNLKFTLLSSDL